MKKTKPVLYISVIITALITLFAITFSETFAIVSNSMFGFLTKNFTWLYLLAMLVFVCFSLVIAFSKYGTIRLGKDSDKPEYSTFSWFAMLFCAGMGVGLVFWGISEPVTHYLAPNNMTGQTIEAADFAIRTSFVHWGVHPWSAYAVVGLGLAYFQFRKGLPGLISSTLVPLFGEKVSEKWIGIVVDILAVFATIAGIVTSLGLGVMQISAGLERLFSIPSNSVTQITIIAIVTVIFIWSSVSGLDKGIKILSNGTLILSVILLAIVFILGPKMDMLNNMINGIGSYFQNFISESLTISTYGDNSWIEGWRVFYWAWWIAWAPFTGLFIARISKGRTIREFILGVVVAPTVFSIIWFSIMGTMGISMAWNGILSANELQLISSAPELGLFIIFEHFGIGKFVSVIAIVLLIFFFITSADSGTFVLATMTSNGDINPAKKLKIVWGVLEAALAVGLLLSGGLKPLQTISIVAAFPFVFIMIMEMISMIKELWNNKNE